MTVDRLPGDDPREWLNRARSNLTQSRQEHPSIYLEDLCFQAQQAAEKALKALLLFHGESFPYTHDIAHLLSLVERNVEVVPDELQDAAILTRYAVATRYPGVIEPVTRDEYVEAIELAELLVNWVGDLIRRDE